MPITFVKYEQMEHKFIINIWKQAARPMFSGFQREPQRIAVFDTAVGVELRLAW